MNNTSPPPPEALLFITPQCPHCPSVLQGLTELLKHAHISRLEVVNIMARPDIGKQYGVRSVPWIKIGNFELQGLHSAAELQQWAERAGTTDGTAVYYTELLKQGQLPKALATIHKYPEQITALLHLAENPDTEFTVRIGVSAILEDLVGSELLQEQLPRIINLAKHTDPRVRADACHFLSLTRTDAACIPLQRLTKDPETSVREVAKDSLEELQKFFGS